MNSFIPNDVRVFLQLSLMVQFRFWLICCRVKVLIVHNSTIEYFCTLVHCGMFYLCILLHCLKFFMYAFIGDGVNDVCPTTDKFRKFIVDISFFFITKNRFMSTCRAFNFRCKSFCMLSQSRSLHLIARTTKEKKIKWSETFFFLSIAFLVQHHHHASSLVWFSFHVLQVLRRRELEIEEILRSRKS